MSTPQGREIYIENTVGLCRNCRHVERILSSRGSNFYLCRRSRSDPAFVKYPRLPVLSCPGYAAERTEADGRGRCRS